MMNGCCCCSFVVVVVVVVAVAVITKERQYISPHGSAAIPYRC